MVVAPGSKSIPALPALKTSILRIIRLLLMRDGEHFRA